MSGGRDRDDGGVDLADEFAEVGECGARVGSRNLGGAISVYVHYGHEFSALRLADDADVVLSELADTHDGNAQSSHD